MTTSDPTRPGSGRHRVAKPGKPEKPTKPAKAPKAEQPTKPTEPAKVALAKNAAATEVSSAPAKRRRKRGGIGYLATGLVAAVTIACAVVGTVLIINTSRHNDAVGQARGVADASSTSVAVASTDVQDILSYDYRTISSDIDKAKSESTGQLLTDYNSTAKKLLAQAPSIKAIVKATVSGQAVVQAQGDRATVLLYVDQASVRQLKGAKTPTTRIDPLRIQATMAKVNGRWLVSDLESK
jgi:Mce-associated membrane protein